MKSKFEAMVLSCMDPRFQHLVHNHLNRLVTLSPLTEMATNFHERNGAKLIQINETTQNFEYKVI